MATEPVLRLRPAALADRFLIRRWVSDNGMRGKHVNAASAEAEFTLAMSSAAALPRIIMRDDAAIGYAHAVETGQWSAEPVEGVPAGAWEVTYIMEDPPRDAGVGGAVLAMLTAEVFTTTLAVACSAKISITDEIAARAYENSGFRWLRVLQDPLSGPCWLMLKERPQQTH